MAEGTLESPGQAEPGLRQGILKPAHHRHFLIIYGLTAFWSPEVTPKRSPPVSYVMSAFLAVLCGISFFVQ